MLMQGTKQGRSCNMTQPEVYKGCSSRKSRLIAQYKIPSGWYIIFMFKPAWLVNFVPGHRNFVLSRCTNDFESTKEQIFTNLYRPATPWSYGSTFNSRKSTQSIFLLGQCRKCFYSHVWQTIKKLFSAYTAPQKHESTLLHTCVLNELLTSHRCQNSFIKGVR